jgi:plastocyanin
MRYLRIAVAVIGLVFLAAGCGSDPATPDEDGILTITMDDTKFTPAEIDLKVGEPVRLILHNKSVTHDLSFRIGSGPTSQAGSVSGFTDDFFKGVAVKVIGPAKLITVGEAILTREGDGAVEESDGGNTNGNPGFTVLKGPSSEATVIEFIVPDKWELEWEFASFGDGGDGLRGVLNVFPCIRAGGAWGQKNAC